MSRISVPALSATVLLRFRCCPQQRRSASAGSVTTLLRVYVHPAKVTDRVHLAPAKSDGRCCQATQRCPVTSPRDAGDATEQLTFLKYAHQTMRISDQFHSPFHVGAHRPRDRGDRVGDRDHQAQLTLDIHSPSQRGRKRPRFFSSRKESTSPHQTRRIPQRARFGAICTGTSGNCGQEPANAKNILRRLSKSMRRGSRRTPPLGVLETATSLPGRRYSRGSFTTCEPPRPKSWVRLVLAGISGTCTERGPASSWFRHLH